MEIHCRIIDAVIEGNASRRILAFNLGHALPQMIMRTLGVELELFVLQKSDIILKLDSTAARTPALAVEVVIPIADSEVRTRAAVLLKEEIVNWAGALQQSDLDSAQINETCGIAVRVFYTDEVGVHFNPATGDVISEW